MQHGIDTCANWRQIHDVLLYWMSVAEEQMDKGKSKGNTYQKNFNRYHKQVLIDIVKRNLTQKEIEMLKGKVCNKD
jgi:hypothetical protein